MIFKRSFLLGCITLGLSACGGGGEEETAPPATKPPVATNNAPVLGLNNNDVVFNQGSAQSGDLVASYTVTDSDGDNVTVTISDVTNYVLADGEIHLSKEGATIVNNGTDLPDFTLTPNDGKVNGSEVNVDPMDTTQPIITNGTVLSGTITFGTASPSFDGIIDPFGNIHIKSTSPVFENGDTSKPIYYHISSKLNISDGAINSSTVTVYQSIEGVEEIATVIGSGTITGQISVNDLNGTTLTANIEYDGTSHEVRLQNTDIYNDFGASFSTINKVWSQDVMQSFILSDSSWVVVSIAFDIDGVLSGSDDDGCVFEGESTIHNPELNSYELALTISSCDAAGEYTGLAYTNNQIVDNTGLRLFISNESNSYWLELE